MAAKTWTGEWWVHGGGDNAWHGFTYDLQRPPPAAPPPLKADFAVDNTLAHAGAMIYGRCGGCHGPGAIAGGMAPDLRASAVITRTDSFGRIVRDGARAVRGMPAYADLTDQELRALQHYIRQQANRALPKP